MKKILFIAVCCLLLCGCDKDWKDKIEITDTIYTSSGIQLKVKPKKNQKYNNVCIKVKLTQEKTSEEDIVKYCTNIDYGKETTFFFDTNIEDIYQGLNYDILEVTF